MFGLSMLLQALGITERFGLLWYSAMRVGFVLDMSLPHSGSEKHLWSPPTFGFGGCLTWQTSYDVTYEWHRHSPISNGLCVLMDSRVWELTFCLRLSTWRSREAPLSPLGSRTMFVAENMSLPQSGSEKHLWSPPTLGFGGCLTWQTSCDVTYNWHRDSWKRKEIPRLPDDVTAHRRNELSSSTWRSREAPLSPLGSKMTLFAVRFLRLFGVASWFLDPLGSLFRVRCWLSSTNRSNCPHRLLFKTWTASVSGYSEVVQLVGKMLPRYGQFCIKYLLVTNFSIKGRKVKANSIKILLTSDIETNRNWYSSMMC